MVILSGVEKEYISDVDVNLFVKGNAEISFTDDNTKDRVEWAILKPQQWLKISAGKTYYFFCPSNNIIAEISA